MTEETRRKEILSILDLLYKDWKTVALIIDHRLKIRNEVRAGGNSWDRICSSSDMVNDTTRAIESYVESDYPDDLGLRYIFIYGLLQALYLQQDALESLFKAFHECYPKNDRFLYKRNEDLQEVRLLRNEVTGHPTGTFSKEASSETFTYLNRGEFSKWYFKKLRCSETKGDEFLPPVDLFSVLKKQAFAIKNDLEILAEKLERLEETNYDNQPEN